MTEPKWKRFEALAYEIQRELAPDAEVKLNDSILGHESKTYRQIDISIRRQVGQFSLLLVIDCKDYKAPVDVKDVGEFATTVQDIGANKGAVVSSSGFTPAAIELAKSRGIDTFRLVDTGDTDWRAYVAIPVLLKRTHVRSFSFTFEGFTTKGSTILASIRSIDPRFLAAFTDDGTRLGLLQDIVAKKWNEGQVPHEPGDHEVPLGESLRFDVGSERVVASISATVRVERTHYFGHLPIKVRGFKDEQGGGLFTREIVTETIEPGLIERGLVEGWKSLGDPKELAVQPAMALAYSDVIPLSEDSENESLDRDQTRYSAAPGRFIYGRN